mgnify:CR=1 FL=1
MGLLLPLSVWSLLCRLLCGCRSLAAWRHWPTNSGKNDVQSVHWRFYFNVFFLDVPCRCDMPTDMPTPGVYSEMLTEPSELASFPSTSAFVGSAEGCAETLGLLWKSCVSPA